jgi:hypothetical protein
VPLAQVLDVRLEAAADVNLGLAVSYQGDANFPRLFTDFHLGWAFSPTDPGLAGGTPQVAFNDVRLDLGSFVTQFAGPLLAKVKQVLEPVRPIVQLLTDPLPVISEFEGRPTSLWHIGIALCRLNNTCPSDVRTMSNEAQYMPGTPQGANIMGMGTPIEPVNATPWQERIVEHFPNDKSKPGDWQAFGTPQSPRPLSSIRAP